MMPPNSRRNKQNQAKAARARAAKAALHAPEAWPDINQCQEAGISESDSNTSTEYHDFNGLEEYNGSWDGGVGYTPESSDESDSDWEEESDEGTESDLEDEWGDLELVEGEVDADLDPEEILQNLREQSAIELQKEVKRLLKPTPYESLMQPKSMQHWKNAESNRKLGYNKQSDRTKRYHEKNERDAAAAAETSRNGSVLFGFCYSVN
jgi:hypothetical protein